MTEDTDGPKRPLALTRSEKVKNYLIGIGATSALILGLFAQFKGEPKAEETWTVLRANMNKQAEELNRIRMRLHYFQAYQEAQTALKLQEKLDDLQQRYDALLARSKTKEPAEKSPPAPTPTKLADCREGLVRGVDGRCHRVRRSVAKAVRSVAAKAEETERKLTEEKARRLAAERKKRDLLRKIKKQIQQKSADLPALPEKLDDAASL